VTSQSLKAVVAGSAREYAVLNALGVSRAALGRVVVEQACWIGGLGFVLAALASAVLLSIASAYRVPVALNLSAVLPAAFWWPCCRCCRVWAPCAACCVPTRQPCCVEA
jgi:putative ABC transport system permease protein